MTVYNAKGKRVYSRKAFRHQKVDRETTTARQFLDPRSFVNIHGQTFREGQDMTVLRDACMNRASLMCQGCSPRHYLRPEEGEMHHVRARGNGGSDDLDNVIWVCHEYHRAQHVQIGGKK